MSGVSSSSEGVRPNPIPFAAEAAATPERFAEEMPETYVRITPDGTRRLRIDEMGCRRLHSDSPRKRRLRFLVFCAAGRVSTLTVDSRDNLTEIADPDGAETQYGDSTHSRRRMSAADAQRPVAIWGMAAPSAPTNPAMVAWAALPVLKPPTVMVTLKLPGL